MDIKIKITINGQEVEGQVTHRCASDITVKITKPYQNVSRGLHIPYFARPCTSFDSDFGDKTAKGSKEYNVGFMPGQTNFVDKIK